MLWSCPACNTQIRDNVLVMEFPSERIWKFGPGILLHLMVVHNFKPPVDFCQDVIEGNALMPETSEARSAATTFGFVTNTSFPSGRLPRDFERIFKILIRDFRKKYAEILANSDW